MKKLLALTLLSLSFAAFAAGGKQMTFDVEVEKNGKTLAAASLVTEDGAETPLSMRNVKTYLAKVVNGKEEMGTVETGRTLINNNLFLLSVVIAGFAVMLFLSIVGIPAAMVVAKSLGTYLNPVGKKKGVSGNFCG